MSESFWKVVPLLACTILFVGLVAIWWSRRPQLPRLGQKMTAKEERRVRLIVIMGAEMEIRELLKQAIDEGIAIENLPALHALLQRFYMHPDRYERIPSINDASIRGTPLPYEGA